MEAEGKLVKIEMVPFGDGQPILASHAMEQAFELAEVFAQTLHQRAKAAGFIKTLLQRRVGSSLEAGLKTTRKMLQGRVSRTTVFLMGKCAIVPVFCARKIDGGPRVS